MSSTKKRQLSSISIIAIIAVLLIALILCTVLFSTYGHKRLEAEPIADDEQNADVNGGMSMEDSMVGNGIMLLSTTIPVEQYGEYDISPLAETAKRLTATVTPSSATDTKVDWSIAWKNPSSAWASGKTVTNYVTVKATSNGALTANVTCLQAFGEQIIITVSVRDNANIKATCTVDYKQRYLGTSTRLSFTTIPDFIIDFSTTTAGGIISTNIPNSLTIPWYFNYAEFILEKSDTYTIPLSGKVSFDYYMKLTDDFRERLEMENTMSGYSLDVSKDWVNGALYTSCDAGDNSCKFDTNPYREKFSVPLYLSFLAGGIYQGSGYVSNQYVGFVNAVHSVNNMPSWYSDYIHFQIKIVTEIEGETYETITNVHLNSVTLPASSISLDTTGLLF